jgi:hypothetical protein
VAADEREEVTLCDFDPDGETKVVAAALYASSALPDDQLLGIARQMTPDVRAQVLRAYVGDAAIAGIVPAAPSSVRRIASTSSPITGRFRDLQRHRLLTLEWQPLTTRHGYSEPAAMVEAGGQDAWRRGDGRIGRTARAAPCERTRGDCPRTRWRWPTACVSTWT